MLLDQAGAAALGLDGEAAPELELAVDQVGLAAPDRVELHALPMQPAHRVARATHQAVAQVAVGPVVGDAEHVVIELVGGVGAEVGALDLLLGQVRHDRLEVVDAVVDAAERPRGEARIAAHQLLRRALDHQHAGAVLARRQRRAERRIAGADHHHIPLLPRHVSFLRIVLNSAAQSDASVGGSRAQPAWPDRAAMPFLELVKLWLLSTLGPAVPVQRNHFFSVISVATRFHVRSGLNVDMSKAICTVRGPRSFSYTSPLWLTTNVITPELPYCAG